MIPANLQDKLVAFTERSRRIISGLIGQTIEEGRSPEDLIFVIPAEDADSQKVTAVMFGLEAKAAAGPLPQGFAVGKDDFFASIGQIFEKYEPDICRGLRTRIYGEAEVLVVVDGYFCYASVIYMTGGRRLPQA